MIESVDAQPVETGAKSVPSSRWLVLTQYYPPEIGAPQVRLQAMVGELRRRGIDVTVLTAFPNYPEGKIYPGYEGKWRMRETVAGVPVRRVWIYAAAGRSMVRRLANYLSFTLTAAIATLTGPKPDVLFVESQPLSLGGIAILMKWLRRVRYVYNVPDLQVDVARQLGFAGNRFFLGLAFAMENFFLRQAWRVSTVTHRFIEHFEQRGVARSRITFLPNGADTEFLRPLPPDAGLLERWKLHGRKVFLYVGTHAYYHGLDTVIDAAELLRDRSDIAFLLVGYGPERQRLKQLAADRKLQNVIFGDSPYEERDRLYSITYASIATLRNIDVARSMRPAKLFPSLSCAVPVIFTGEGETAELLRQHKCGLAVPPEHPQRLSESIIEMAEAPSLRDSMGRAGRDLVERDYSWSRIVDRWLNELPLQGSGLSPKSSRKIEQWQ